MIDRQHLPLLRAHDLAGPKAFSDIAAEVAVTSNSAVLFLRVCRKAISPPAVSPSDLGMIPRVSPVRLAHLVA